MVGDGETRPSVRLRVKLTTDDAAVAVMAVWSRATTGRPAAAADRWSAVPVRDDVSPRIGVDCFLSTDPRTRVVSTTVINIKIRTV